MLKNFLKMTSYPLTICNTYPNEVLNTNISSGPARSNLITLSTIAVTSFISNLSMLDPKIHPTLESRMVWWFEKECPPIGSYIWILSHQGVALLEIIKRIRRCDLVGGSVSLRANSEVLKAQAKPRASFSARGSGCSSYLLLQHLSAWDASSHHDKGLSHWNCKPAAMSGRGHGVTSQRKNNG